MGISKSQANNYLIGKYGGTTRLPNSNSSGPVRCTYPGNSDNCPEKNSNGSCCKDDDTPCLAMEGGRYSSIDY